MRAQSSDQYYPTPITSNEITGAIKARDLGDARLTTYYYAFNGTQGDIFINVVTRNFNGDIDVYLLDGLKPLTKMVIYADNGSYETGRLIYLRKPEKLMLRIEGRTPGDEAASYRIKFGGSFVALSSKLKNGDQSAPRISSSDNTGVRVNTVGTIIPPPIGPPIKKGNQEADRAATAKSEKSAKIADSGDAKTGQAVKPEITPPDKSEKSVDERSSEPVESSGISKTSAPDSEKSEETVKPNKSAPKSAVKPTTKRPVRSSTSTRVSKPAAPPKTSAQSGKAPDPIEGVRLVILLKNGRSFEYKMTEVVRFTADKGALVVLGKDGNISRYPMLEVAKVTIQ